MNCIKNIKNLLAVSMIVAMFATLSIQNERQRTASYWADFLCPPVSIGCSTPSQKLNGSAARFGWKAEGKAAPLFCLRPTTRLSVMPSTEKTCRRAKHSTPMATPTERNTVPVEKYRAAVRAQAAATRTLNRLLSILQNRACPFRQPDGLVGLHVVYNDRFIRRCAKSGYHPADSFPVPECGYFTVQDAWLELDGRVLCRLDNALPNLQPHVIAMAWLTPYDMDEKEILKHHYQL